MYKGLPQSVCMLYLQDSSSPSDFFPATNASVTQYLNSDPDNNSIIRVALEKFHRFSKNLFNYI